MKPIYILNYFSGERQGQEKVCYYNNQATAGVVWLLTWRAEPSEEEDEYEV